MSATVGVEIAGKRAEQRKAEGEGEAHYIQQTGRAEAEKAGEASVERAGKKAAQAADRAVG